MAQGRTLVIVTGAPYRPVVRNLPRLEYRGPPIAVTDDAARAAMIVDRIRTRCHELTNADLVLAARVINASQRGKDGRPARAPKGRPNAV